MRILHEDALKQQVNKFLNQVDDVVITEEGDKGDIEKNLDRALDRARRAKRHNTGRWENLLIIGEGGTGKTSRVYQWGRENGINIVYKDAKTLDQTDLGGLPAINDERTRATKLSTDELDLLNEPDSVLFLDEWNRAKKDIRGTLLTLINEHYIVDAHIKGGKLYFPNFLFTVACINPPTPGYNVDELDSPELTRFKQMTVAQVPRQYRNYIIKEFRNELADLDPEDPYDAMEAQETIGKIRLVDKLLSSPEFKFDSPEEVAETQSLGLPALNYRSLTNLLVDCDGTKKDFLDQWDSTVNPAKHEMAERILASYTDKDDKANSVFKGDNRPAFMKGPSVWDKIKNNI